MVNKQILIPMDRLSIESVQINTMTAVKFINDDVKRNEVRWLLEEQRLNTERFDNHLKDTAAILETKINGNKMILYSPHAEFGNIGVTQRSKSQIFQLITNGLLYLSV